MKLNHHCHGSIDDSYEAGKCECCDIASSMIFGSCGITRSGGSCGLRDKWQIKVDLILGVYRVSAFQQYGYAWSHGE